MNNRNYKTVAPISIIEAFHSRVNKKDSFERWFNKSSFNAN